MSRDRVGTVYDALLAELVGDVLPLWGVRQDSPDPAISLRSASGQVTAAEVSLQGHAAHEIDSSEVKDSGSPSSTP
ncbi:hypothetical protein ACTXJ8_14960 [Corynebacterium variabile]|uniref:hypothetical protein n=1 Tax=Corynebacterium variabile TaxID=1727 RepID=UPI003FD15B4B